ncbi:polysaccharide biosynthesis protein, partial [Escherichia coli]|nr:polysaccharide biosynthesis protein [Escherichia coli]
MSLLKISSIYLFSNILNALIPFLLLPILTHNLTPNEYGQVAMFQTLISG